MQNKFTQFVCCIAMLSSFSNTQCSHQYARCAWDAGKEIYVPYMEDIAGYLWTQYHTEPQEYAYRQSTEKTDCQDMRIMTFNIQRVKDEPALNVWQRRPWFSSNRLWRIVDIFKQFTPDIIGLQEIQPGMADALENEIPYGYTYAQSDNFDLCSTFPNLIVYNKHRFTLEDVRVIPISVQKYRLIVRADMYDHETDTKFVVYNIHQDHISKTITKELRDKGYALLNEDIKQLDKPYIIIGDFNVDYDIILENIDNVNPAYNGETPSWIAWDDENAASGLLIDGIFLDTAIPQEAVRNSFVVTSQDEVDTDGTMHHDQRASDHRPLLADIRFAG